MSAAKPWVRDRATGELVCQKCRKPRVRGPSDNLDDARAVFDAGNEQDPCIAGLPGVIAACCGHGVGSGYVLFADGRTLYGVFGHHAVFEAGKFWRAIKSTFIRRHRRSSQT